MASWQPLLSQSTSKRSFDTYTNHGIIPNHESEQSATKRPRLPEPWLPAPDPILHDTICQLPIGVAHDMLYNIVLQVPAMRHLIEDARREQLQRDEAAHGRWVQQSITPPVTGAGNILYQQAGYNHGFIDGLEVASVQNGRSNSLGGANGGYIVSPPPVNFDRYSKSCWHVMNTEHSHLSSSKKFDAVGDIMAVLDNARDTIVQKAGPGAHFETKKSGLEVLRKISKSIMLCDEQVIAHQIMKDGCMLDQFADAMERVVLNMTPPEREMYKNAEGGVLWHKLNDLQTEENVANDVWLKKVYAAFGSDPLRDESCDDYIL